MDKKQIIDRVQREYDAEIQPLVGQGELKNRLLSGLTRVLEASSIEDGHFIVEKRGPEADLDDYIDFESMGKPYATRMSDALSSKNIHSYRELIKYMKGRKSSYGLLNINGFGKKSLRVLVDHCEQRGITLPHQNC